MHKTDTSEKGLETLIVNSLVSEANYEQGTSEDYSKEYAIDLKKFFSFLQKTQPQVLETLKIENEGIERKKFLDRIQGEIASRGIIDVLRKGIKHHPYTDTINMFYGSPSAANLKAKEQYDSNIFSVTRQLHFSNSNTMLSLDMAAFINGLPVITFELKNSLTKQTVWDAIQQYKEDRDPRELLFQFGRCMVHFAVDDQQVMMCTHLKGKASWFLPFNKGYNDGAGNPPNPNGLATDYLWKEILQKDSLTNIIENYAQIVEKEDKKTKKKKKEQIFPRYHQLSAVRMILADAQGNGAGKKYLIQHSAGSGKSNSIAWLSHQLVGLEQDNRAIFDSIIVVTDRKNLDDQIKSTVKQFAQVGSIVGHADRSSTLRDFIKDGKKIIITTIQKFPFVLNEIGDQHRGNKFAIIIDEAHSSQGGKVTGKMNIVLSENSADDDESYEDLINRVMESRKMLNNASYFAFTATPKNRTLETFGEPYKVGDETKFKAFHSYTMKQAIQEGFILDVLKYYTPVYSYYKLAKTVEDDPDFDAKKAKKKLRKYVESHEHAIRQKAEIMVDDFHTNVIAKNKIGGKARAMVVTNGIDRAIQYYTAFNEYLKERKSPYKTIVAFSGEKDYAGKKVTEADLNDFPSKDIPDMFQEDPYRFLIVADKFQTGFDEPLLHTMYVDKPLSDIKAVQTLSRLNRAHPQKHDTFVLDFMNDTKTIELAFSTYYRTTILSEETDPNRLHDLKGSLDAYQVYAPYHLDNLMKLFLDGAERDRLDPILDTCVAIYQDQLNEDEQGDFKAKAKTFVRTYNFLSSILSYSNLEWEKLATFLNFLTPKLPAPKEEDLSKGILEAIDMDSYRAEVKASISINLPDMETEINPIPATAGGGMSEPEIDKLSNIIKNFNELFGSGIEWKDKDKIAKVIAEEIPSRVAADKAYQNAKKNSDKQNARIEHDKALSKVIRDLLFDHSELAKQFRDNPSFKKWLADHIFDVTYYSDVDKSA